ncbi:TetR/AcrR family transcriptional regulator [Rhodococcus sp. HNM0563]|uniref:TetR/AcrR family transcriptional regulator n=1 Tax=unclassified Rhodococcus (in: high G+C Gram-positive bacteria) TaxID=192944 RepID=UPI00146C19A1|nr:MULTISPECIES: TetR/AcrR family transcriptional regulator [unclassified Rhodococcus (in: high G+C Gram-positive bacteria)]MCK0092978.1 TetR/AcrR family transcriptional regulator [Rhodococcus sp. F64268]NLU62673.1 TetR/AcrR family transcriptional regulator [Rhodococcus sp. HNM0563]
MARGTRDKMVASATEVLRERGLTGTSFDRVLEHSGAPRGSVRHHFPGGKSEMIQAAVDRAGNEVTARLSSAIDRGATAAQLVEGVCDYFGKWLLRSDYHAGCPVAAVAQEGYGDPALRDSTAAALGRWVDILASSLRDEDRSTGDADELAAMCVAAIEGAIMMARVQRSLTPLEATSKQLRILLHR